jgi:predicted SAM-dependent methyltransferase
LNIAWIERWDSPCKFISRRARIKTFETKQTDELESCMLGNLKRLANRAFSSMAASSSRPNRTADNPGDALAFDALHYNRTISALGHEVAQLRARMSDAERNIGGAWDRLELVRREILFELAHGGPNRDFTKTQPRLKTLEKISQAKASNSLRLNLGCGHIAIDGYVNVDMRDLPGVDVIADVDALPFEPETVDEIFSSHIIEHFPQERLIRRLLPYWFSLLKPNGRFRAITPDAAAMLKHAATGTYAFEDFRQVLFGAQDYDGDYHYNMLTPESMSALLKTAGFCDIGLLAQGRRNGLCFEFEIQALKPSSKPGQHKS